MKIYNTAPYFDDFDENKGFHQILFKPGFAVQARELTQLQTILQKQIERFGNHVFKHGSVVIPGNSFAELNAPYVKIASLNNTSLLPSAFESKVVVGLTTGVRAIVKKTVAATPTDPIVFYLGYLSGAGATGGVTFQAGEQIYIEDAPGLVATVATGSYSGFGALASVNAGVYYINGYFVYTPKQTIVFDKFSNQPSGSVVFKITEAIISSTDDETLLDPAQGSYNYAAPGADRLRISLDLGLLPLASSITEDYVELMRYDSGELLEHSRYPKYSELEKSLARRTFDESGNYVVSGFYPTVKEHLKEGRNNGVFTDGDKNKLVYEVSTGKAYIEGFEVEKLSRTRLVADKARTPEHVKSKEETLRPLFGQYVYLSNITGSFSIQNRDIITFYNDSDPTNSSATAIGTARVIGIDYVSVLSVAAGIYKVYLSDVNLTGSFLIEDAGGIRFGSSGHAYVMTKYVAPISSGGFVADELITNSSGRIATVKYFDIVKGELYAYKHDHTKQTPKPGDEITGSVSNTTTTPTSKAVLTSEGINAPIFRLPVTVASSFLNDDIQYDLEYVVQKELVIATDALGQGSVTISNGVIDPIEDGTFVAFTASGAVPISSFGLNSAGNTLSFSNSSYASATIYVYAHVTKTNISPKTKTATTVTETFANGLGTKTLANTDIIEIISVIDSQGDITPNYTFDNGQTEYGYNKGTITLSSGTAVGSISVTYRYFAHSISGDFFCVDSYSSYPDYMDKVPFFTSKTTGERYNLYNCIDFRPSIGTLGYSGSGARPIDLIVPNTVFRTNLKYYVGRVDSLVLQKTGQPIIITGTPDINPTSPIIPAGLFELSRMYVPPYTYGVASVQHSRLDISRYTMNDISRIVRRIERVEEFTTLTLDEQRLASFEIVDPATGLSRFKTGYLVEDFSQPLVMARKTDKNYRASFLSNNVTALRDKTIVDLRITDNSSGYQTTGNFMCLPFTSKIIFEQNQSSRITNVNPFLVIRWDGTLEVIPPRDDHVEMRDLPTIYETVENVTRETVYETVYVPPPPPAPAPIPAAPQSVGVYIPVYEPPAPEPDVPQKSSNLYQLANSNINLYNYTGFESPAFAGAKINMNTLSGTITVKDARSGEERQINVTGSISDETTGGRSNPLGPQYVFKDNQGNIMSTLVPADVARAERIGYTLRDTDNLADGSFEINNQDKWKK